MPANQMGSKFICYKCQTKFYDMKKPDPLCPKCGADQRESPALKPPSEGRRGRLAAVPKVIEPVEPAAEEATEEVAAEEDEFEDDDDDDLPADDDA